MTTNTTLTLRLPFVLGNYFSFKIKWKIIWTIFLFFSILLLSSFLILYIVQVTAEISERYLLKNYQDRFNELEKENKSLEINSVQVNSLSNIASLIEKLNFEKSEKIHYINILNGQVVSK